MEDQASFEAMLVKADGFARSPTKLKQIVQADIQSMHCICVNSPRLASIKAPLNDTILLLDIV